MMKRFAVMVLFFMGSLKAEEGLKADEDLKSDESEKKFALGIGVNSVLMTSVIYLFKTSILERENQFDDFHFFSFGIQPFFVLKPGLALKTTYEYFYLKSVFNPEFANKETDVNSEARTHDFSVGPVWAENFLKGFYAGVLFGATTGEQISTFIEDPKVHHFNLSSAYLTPLFGYAWKAPNGVFSNLDVGLLLGRESVTNQETKIQNADFLTKLKFKYFIGFAF
jgi:hypothetical protein